MIHYNLPITVARRGSDRFDMAAIDAGDMFLLPVDADIEEGDRVERSLPNGKIRTVHITKVDVLQSPFGSSELDHTEAHYTTTVPRDQAATGPTTVNVHGGNVQVATGERSRQTMTVGPTAEDLTTQIHDIAELIVALGVVTGREAELDELKTAALAEVKDNKPGAAVRRFASWVGGCVKTGATSAVVATVNAATSGLMHDAEALLRAAGS